MTSRYFLDAVVLVMPDDGSRGMAGSLGMWRCGRADPECGDDPACACRSVIGPAQRATTTAVVMGLEPNRRCARDRAVLLHRAMARTIADA